MVSDQQVKRLWRLVQTELTLEVAAARAGMDAWAFSALVVEQDVLFTLSKSGA